MPESPTILKALSLLNKNAEINNPDSTTSRETTLPTAKSLATLTKMMAGTSADYNDVNLRNLLQELLNWNGGNKVNKPLIRAYGDLLKQPSMYVKLVEFTGFMMAVAPLLEADHLVSLLEVVPKTKTAFAPTVYTVNFHSNVKRAFADLSPVRIERIAKSLWEESHQGRWWNMTAGIGNIQDHQGEVSPSNLLKSIKNYDKPDMMENIIWSPHNQEKFTQYISTRLDGDLAKVSEQFRLDLMAGKAITPDIAIFLSSVPWLAPNQRPESPVNSLLRTLANIRENPNDYFTIPKKPNNIKEMFPQLTVVGGLENGVDYPFDHNIVQYVQNKKFTTGLNKSHVKECRLIVNHTQLANNANFMGNCTLTYERYMLKGEYALLYLVVDDRQYNCSIVKRNNRWCLGEINSRHNRGNVPENLRKHIVETIKELPPISKEYQQYSEEFQKRAESNPQLYSYTI